MNNFTDALKQRNLEELRKHPKADLHNHFVLGGSRSFLYQATDKRIEPITHPMSSMDEMEAWSQKYIGQYFNSTEMRKLLIKAAFQQAKEDGVTVLEIGEDVWGLGEFFNNDIDELVDAFTSAQKEIAPDKRPAFHLTPRVGWMNDPNGFIYYKGMYHLFYQCFPYGPRWGRMHWGHVVSKDLVNWEEQGIALFPSKTDDRSGCFSGSAIEEDGKMQL